jgi:hypothetical protein
MHWALHILCSVFLLFSCIICSSPSALPCRVLSRLFHFQATSREVNKDIKVLSPHCVEFHSKDVKDMKVKTLCCSQFHQHRYLYMTNSSYFQEKDALLLNCWNTWNAIFRQGHMHKSCCPYDRDESMRFHILNNSVSLDFNLSNTIKIKKM